jgi:hypothetical protein
MPISEGQYLTFLGKPKPQESGGFMWSYLAIGRFMLEKNSICLFIDHTGKLFNFLLTWSDINVS